MPQYIRVQTQRKGETKDLIRILRNDTHNKITNINEEIRQVNNTVDECLEAPNSDFMKMKMWFLEHHPEVLD